MKRGVDEGSNAYRRRVSGELWTPDGDDGRPDLSWVADSLGLVPALEASEWPDELNKVYLTANEYIAPVIGEQSLRLDVWLWGVLQQHSREDLVAVLALLNQATTDKALLKQCEDQYLSMIHPDIARSARFALQGGIEGKPRVFLARQCILRTLRAVLVPPTNIPGVPAAGASALPDPFKNLLRGMPLVVAGILLVHITAAEMNRSRPANEPTLARLPESLAMEIVANNIFNEVENPGTLLARTWMLWRDYGPRVSSSKARKPPLEMLTEATGIDLEDLLAIAFCYYAKATAYAPDRGVRINAFDIDGVDRDVIDQFLSRFAITLDDLASQLAACPESWQTLPMQDRPLLRVGDDVIVLDTKYLLERVTRGLYWLVHDHERDSHGDEARNRWTQVYGDMIEFRVEDQLRRLAPPLIGQSSTFFTEEDLRAAFHSKGKAQKNVDTGIDFGEAVLLAEVVSGQVSVPTRSQANVDAFKKDVERLALKKIRQLDVSATNLLLNPQPSRSPLPAPANKIRPVVVQGGGFPVNVVTRRYIDECSGQEHLLTHPSIERLSILDMEELDVCEALHESRGLSLLAILEGWASSKYRNASLRTYLALCMERETEQAGRTADLRRALDEALAAIAARLGSEWRAPDGDTNPSTEEGGDASTTG